MAEMKVFPGYGLGETERREETQKQAEAAMNAASPAVEAATVAAAELEARRRAEIAARAELEAAKEAQRQCWVKQFRPRGDYVFLEIVVREQTAGGIVLPDERKELPGHGTVLAVGPNVTKRQVTKTKPGFNTDFNESNWTPAIAVGDHVWFSRYCGASIEFPDGSQDARYRIVSEGEIFGHFVGLGDEQGPRADVPVSGIGDGGSAGSVATV